MSAQPPQFILPQFGIFAQGTHAHHFLEFDLRPGVDAAEAVAAFRRLRTPDVSAGGVNLVAGFGAQLWRSVAPSATPVDLTPFETITGRDGHLRPPLRIAPRSAVLPVRDRDRGGHGQPIAGLLGR